MKRIAPFVFIAFAAFGLLGTPSTAFAHPPCPEDQSFLYWDNCFGAMDPYVGEWKDGLPDGLGTFTTPDGFKYVGEWKDDKRNGQGTVTYANGSKYVGEYRDDKRNGQGTFTFADGRKYVGEFKDGDRHGQGTRYAANGEVLQQGTWENHEFVGP
jgi:hypothetical protein